MHRPNLLAGLVVGFAISFGDVAASAGEESKPQDALQLAEQGKVAIDAVADNAYLLRVRVRNLTDKELNLEFPPGLVADTYARFALFQVGGGGGTSGGGGGQSTGLLFAQLVVVQPDQPVVLNFQTACLNYGAPEPTPKTVMMIKRVEDFTTDVLFQFLLKDIAANPPGEHVAQAAFWHVVDKLDWKKLAKLRTRRGSFSDEDIEAAKSRVEAARSLAASAGRMEESEKKKPRLRLTALSVLVHPDPRGRRQDADLARQAGHRLRQRWPGIDVAHRNFTPTPKNEAADAVAWCFLVRSVGNAKSPDLQVTPQRNVWIADKKRWKHESVGKPFNRTPPSGVAADWLADQFVQHIASKSLIVEKKGEDKLLVRNLSPIGLKDVLVTTSAPKEEALMLLGPALAPGEEAEAELPEEHRERYAAAKRFVVTGFKPTTAAPPGG